ncbi:TrkH family potassium uptake protein [Solibacillus sp. FSL H8-0538]|uniref:TrkH family potassium uptake protein n=1 Tax=Solibacillus sp. FSL H8-0538 TaxID=2921400 RepID=UPI0030FBB3B6
MKKQPTVILIFSFLSLIIIGTCLLKLPFAVESTQSIGWLDAIFTATSAVCVTGLVVVDTADTFSLFGEIIIITLIQLGGLGSMTVASFIFLLFGRSISFKEKLILREAFNLDSMNEISRLIKRIVIYAITIESIGALLLTSRFIQDMPFSKAIYYGIFHSVSNFNNAGFDLFGQFRSLTSYVNDPVVSLTIMSLIILGGLGFLVLDDLVLYKLRRTLSLHSKIVLSMTGFLITIGTLAILFFEWSNTETIGTFSLPEKILAALFHSVTPRTAGANTLLMDELTIPTLAITIVLMFIGAGSGSTASGVKVSTVAILAATVWSQLKGEPETILFKRAISTELILKSFTLVSCSALWVFCVTIVLSITTDGYPFIVYLFEATSAFGTVGLSLGLTPHLTDVSQWMIIATMFIGRIGTLTILFVLLQKKKNSYRHPSGTIYIG